MKRFFSSCFLAALLLSVAVFYAQAADTHIHKYTALYTVKPTCTQEGYTYNFCSCGDSYISDKVSPNGHSYSKDYILVKEPTCTEIGAKALYCTVCFSTSGEVAVDKLTHKKENITLKATTEKDGEKRISCKFCGQIYNSEKICRITEASLNKSTFIYKNTVQKPTVTVSDSEGKNLTEGKDYELIYEQKSKNPGEYTVKIKFIGNYEGEKVFTYFILPVNVKNVTAEPSTRTVTLNWRKVKGADGYSIYAYNRKTKKYIFIKDTDKLYYTVSKIKNKKLSYGTDYVFAVKAYTNNGNDKIYSSVYKKVTTATKPDKAYIKSVRNTSDGITVKWRKQGSDGFELVYATNKSFSSETKVNITSSAKTKRKIKGLKHGETYFMKLRAYKTVKGIKMYGYYSDSVSVKF